MRTLWHVLPTSQLFYKLNSSEKGLTSEDATQRLAKVGKNQFPEEKTFSAVRLLLMQFANPLMYIMIGATSVSFIIGENVTGFFVMFVLLSNALFSFYQEYKANNSLESLKRTIRLQTRILRDGRECEIDTADVVPGDVIILRAGDKVPADARILQANGFKVSEAVLTGESRAAEKNIGVLSEDTEIGDRTNMVFMSTLVEEGTATAIVTTTGLDTEYGQIISVLKATEEEKTPLQKIIISLSKYIGIVITLVVSLIIILNWLQGHTFEEIFESALALFVSAIPEGLLPGITIVLVLGTRQIIKRNALVRRLAATETLGGVTVICTDKTGTLTKGVMEANIILTTDGQMDVNHYNSSDISSVFFKNIEISLLATDAYIENIGAQYSDLVVRGNLTEQALLKMVVRCGLNPYQIASDKTLISSLLFSSDRKYSAFLRKNGDKETLYVLGAPEVVEGRVTKFLTSNGEEKVNNDEYDKLIQQKNRLIESGYRVIACAYKDTSLGENELDQMAQNLVLAGFIAIDDPVRDDLVEAFESTKRAGIRTVIVTGDHAVTAAIVANKLGIKVDNENVLEGKDIDKMTDEELLEVIDRVILYARVSPSHKLRIVKAFQHSGEIVSMFGDGVNDAPALKAANIGVAVDTRVSAAREVADIVLLDGGFTTVVKAIEQGRIIFENIRRVFLYLITQDLTSFFIFFASIIFRLPLPVLGVQMLFVNLVESGLPDLALATEKDGSGLMDIPPRNPKESILNRASTYWLLFVLLIGGGIILGLYLFLLGFEDIDTIRTMIMVSLCIESLFMSLSIRSFKKSLWRSDIFSNRVLTGAIIVSLIIILLGVYNPWLQGILGTVSLEAGEWAIILVANLFEVIVFDALKMYFFRKHN